MKLRFRANSLRLRVNRKEVQTLASGQALKEQIVFPGDSALAYVLETGLEPAASATFAQGTIRILAPGNAVAAWAMGEEIGLYFDLPANGSHLKVAIEKDLECLDGPAEEADVDAFPRGSKSC
jgi:hypothetical protein